MNSSQNLSDTPLNDKLWKLNVDAAWQSSPPSTGIGAICRDPLGVVVGALTSHYDMDFTPPMAEMMAIIEGMKLSISLGCNNISVESDNLQTINFINGSSELRNEIGSLVKEIRQLSSAFNIISFSFISRNCNKIADAIAKRAKSKCCNKVWIDCLPLWIGELVYHGHSSSA